ncbi:unnamed protein product [Echinostoma caproni]|uniref:Peptidase M12B domain-containing protein n=1 Tax=Echinostoma caproni TaxID=27848 RepID=A0A183A5T1_9TREM|nr:unnamed protein product [Echinostoma caproni]
MKVDNLCRYTVSARRYAPPVGIQHEKVDLVWQFAECGGYSKPPDNWKQCHPQSQHSQLTASILASLVWDFFVCIPDQLFPVSLSRYVLRIKNLNGPKIPDDQCVYQASPDESTFAALVTVGNEISGFIAFGRNTVLELSRQAMPVKKDQVLQLKKIYENPDVVNESMKPNTLEVPARMIELYLIGDQEYVYQHHTSFDSASTLVHEMGHLLGLPHEDNSTGDCFCGTDTVCMMSPVTGTPQAVHWSNCSLGLLQTNLMRDTFPGCFRPMIMYTFTSRAICGNRILEDGEECDNEGVCIRGQCASLNRQCAHLFGDHWVAASEFCFLQNREGSSSGGFCAYNVSFGSPETEATYKYIACSTG